MRRIEGQSLTPGYAAIQFFYWLNFVSVSGYASVYLLSERLANSKIGILIGIACILAAVLQPAVASYADRPSSVSIKTIVMICAVFSGVVFCCPVFFGSSSKMLCGILFGSCIVIPQLIMPFINSLGTEMILQGRNINWGPAGLQDLLLMR